MTLVLPCLITLKSTLKVVFLDNKPIIIVFMVMTAVVIYVDTLTNFSPIVIGTVYCKI